MTTFFCKLPVRLCFETSKSSTQFTTLSNTTFWWFRLDHSSFWRNTNNESISGIVLEEWNFTPISELKNQSWGQSKLPKLTSARACTAQVAWQFKIYLLVVSNSPLTSLELSPDSQKKSMRYQGAHHQTRKTRYFTFPILRISIGCSTYMYIPITKASTVTVVRWSSWWAHLQKAVHSLKSPWKNPSIRHFCFTDKEAIVIIVMNHCFNPFRKAWWDGAIKIKTGIWMTLLFNVQLS